MNPLERGDLIHIAEIAARAFMRREQQRYGEIINSANIRIE